MFEKFHSKKVWYCMLIQWYFLVFLVLISIIPAFVAIFLIVVGNVKTKGDITAIIHDVASISRRKKEIEVIELECDEKVASLLKKFQEVEVLSAATRQMIEGCEESVRNLNLKFSARERTDTRRRNRAEKEEEEADVDKMITEAGGIPLTDQQDLFGNEGNTLPNFPGQSVPFGTIP